jgi:hypothetical protein
MLYSPRVMDSPKFPRHAPVNVALVARLLSPVVYMLCRNEYAVFTSKMCVHSRTLLRIQIILCFS